MRSVGPPTAPAHGARPRRPPRRVQASRAPALVARGGRVRRGKGKNGSSGRGGARGAVRRLPKLPGAEPPPPPHVRHRPARVSLVYSAPTPARRPRRPPPVHTKPLPGTGGAARRVTLAGRKRHSAGSAPPGARGALSAPGALPSAPAPFRRPERHSAAACPHGRRGRARGAERGRRGGAAPARGAV